MNLAAEAGIELELAGLNDLSRRVPHICKVSPAHPDVHMEDVDRA
ncbi:hypothetical protein LCGC14_2306410, partial [marine sediment metagenome]